MSDFKDGGCSVLSHAVSHHSRHGRFFMAKMRILLVPMLMVVGSCDGRHPSASDERHYEINVAIQTPQGLVRSSGVLATRGPHGKGYLAGESIPIELPDGRSVYMLVTTPFKSWEFEAPWVNVDQFDEVERGVRTEMAPARRPDFVWFEKPTSPASVKRVPYEDAASQLGPGFAFRELTVARTDKPISTEISRHLPWLKDQKGNVTGSGHSGISYPSNIGHSSFKRFM